MMKVWSGFPDQTFIFLPHIQNVIRHEKNIKKMSVDASRVDSHSNHIINNTKTNNQ
jgi:hypothetical protein